MYVYVSMPSFTDKWATFHEAAHCSVSESPEDFKKVLSCSALLAQQWIHGPREEVEEQCVRWKYRTL